MTVTLLRGDALALPIADHTVDLVVTSPPYFGLRSYQDGGEHYAGQIGSEATPAEWVDAMLAATAEMVRVLKPSGSIWVNLGDKYAAGHGGSSTEGNGVNINVGHRAEANFRERPDLPNPPASWGKRDASGRAIVPGLRPKSLIGLPWRYALACIDQLGLILRAEVIWSKPNGLPESVTDRVRRSHEQWFHLVTQPRYFSAVDEIREAQSGGMVTGAGAKRGHGHGGDMMASGTFSKDGGFNAYREQNGVAYNPLGKLPGSVWSIPSQPLTVPPELGVDHFAAFPMEWPRRLIAGWSPAGVCVGCGEGRRPVSATNWAPTTKHPRPGGRQVNIASGNIGVLGVPRSTTITGYACACAETGGLGRTCPDLNDALLIARPGPSTTPAVVLDPFGGTGTTALVAHVMGRHGISVDMSADYTRLAAWRTTDPGELAKAAQVEKPAAQVSGQDHLFHLEGA